MTSATFTVLLAACATTQVADSTAVATGGFGTLVVEMYGFNKDEGTALAAVYTSKPGFPDDGNRAVAKQTSAIVDRRAKVVFENVPSGHVAVSVLHDLNGDFKMNTNFLGMPKEGYGASRDARGNFGPPSWDDAKLILKPGDRLVLKIRLAY